MMGLRRVGREAGECDKALAMYETTQLSVAVGEAAP